MCTVGRVSRYRIDDRTIILLLDRFDLIVVAIAVDVAADGLGLLIGADSGHDVAQQDVACTLGLHRFRCRTVGVIGYDIGADPLERTAD